MAETAVNFVIEKLMSLAHAELKSLSGLGEGFCAIAEELKSTQAFLIDAEGRAEDDPSVNVWVTQVRTVAYKIEDAIDEYTMLKRKKRNSSTVITKAVQYVYHLPALHRLAGSIKGIKAEVIEINRRKESYNFRKYIAEQGESSSSSAYPPRPLSTLYAEDLDLVGIDDCKAALIKVLNPEGEYGMCSVVAVVGMGGLGKTTVVRKVYKDGAVATSFQFRAWITVSQRYSIVALLKEIIGQFREAAKRITGINTIPEHLEVPKETTDVPTLIDALRNFLLDKRYLVVFDDVWDVELWKYIKCAFPDQGNGSKIFITTRDEMVAAAWKRSHDNHVYKLQPLSPDEAWDLFCNMAFRGDTKLCPSELEPLSLDIVGRCEGLPLAVVAIGSFLSTKPKFLSEWQRLYKNLGFHLQHNSQLKDLRRILFLSYHDLPYYLKPCFLYFGMFPEDYSISRGRLVRLWAAEGFLEKGRTAEEVDEVAEEYLSELCCRNLIQVSEWDFTGKRAKAFRVHDLLHELILHKLKDLSLCQVSQRTCNVDKKFRRLSILSNTVDATFDGSESKFSTRSLFLIALQERPVKIVQGSFLKAVHLLKVLIIEDAPVAHIPDQVGDLYHLCYLSIRKTEVTKLPSSIGKLLNLQTLDLRHSPIIQLPTTVNKLHRLRYLFAYWRSHDVLRGLKLPGGILLNFRELQKLSCMDGSQAGGVIPELINLRQLRKLTITDLKTENGFALCKALENMDQLERLFVKSSGREEILDLQYMTSPPPPLRRLYLHGPVKRFPGWISKLLCVVDLQLVFTGSNLVEDPLEITQSLPNLAYLLLMGGFTGTHLHLPSTGFRMLKSLVLWDFPVVNSITIEAGGLPLLEKLTVGQFPQLSKVPPSIRDIKNVANLRLFIPRAMYDDSDDIFQHILEVHLDFWKAY